MTDLSPEQRLRLMNLESSLIGLRQKISAALNGGLEKNRDLIHLEIGYLQVRLSALAAAGDISPTECRRHASGILGIMNDLK
ncbi:hypothetical protein HKD24_06265 [Gluconobacter sp. LMG 31484]|uniref:Uncharacterized protein n=1 Tax=Gluconobacter vitians TaxID=2728102 RepID=A0ABR9Y4N4_9PROT|nr:hypothetical protein [Gluconobacter vitians]MBF0858817.1 hypothetical protein [Gluconobacter vitians]